VKLKTAEHKYFFQYFVILPRTADRHFAFSAALGFYRGRFWAINSQENNLALEMFVHYGQTSDQPQHMHS
jgi:hypothetical protein